MGAIPGRYTSMMSIDYRVIAIGAIAAHPLWNERAAVRTGYATTTLVMAGDARIIVDPGLPEAAMLARLGERTQVQPADVTHVYLTSFQAECRRSLAAFPDAQWMLSEAEREAAFAGMTERLEDEEDRELRGYYQQQLDILAQCAAAPDAIAPGVDLFPLPGVTPGTCGLLLAQPHATVLICGDAVPTQEHLLQGSVLSTSADVEQAQESFREAIEIADLFILGRDNLTPNPLRRRF